MLKCFRKLTFAEMNPLEKLYPQRGVLGFGSDLCNLPKSSLFQSNCLETLGKICLLLQLVESGAALKSKQEKPLANPTRSSALLQPALEYCLLQVLRLLDMVGLPELVIQLATLAIMESADDWRSQVQVTSFASRCFFRELTQEFLFSCIT